LELSPYHLIQRSSTPFIISIAIITLALMLETTMSDGRINFASIIEYKIDFRITNEIILGPIKERKIINLVPPLIITIIIYRW